MKIKLKETFPVITSIITSGAEVSHMKIEKRASRNAPRHPVDSANANNHFKRDKNTDNRYNILIFNGHAEISKGVIDLGDKDVEMFRIKVNDNGAYMIDIIVEA